VGDLEGKGRKKEIQPKEEIIKGENINEVDTRGTLIKGDAIEKTGEVFHGNPTKVRPPHPSDSKALQPEGGLGDNVEYKDEDGEDPELEGYGEETYDYFTRNVAKLGKSAYSHYVEKIKEFFVHDQQYYAVRLFNFVQQSMPVSPDLYQIMTTNYLEKGRFSQAFFYLEQMKRNEIKPTEKTLDAFMNHFSSHPSKANQHKFEAIVDSLGLTSSTVQTRRRGK